MSAGGDVVFQATARNNLGDGLAAAQRLHESGRASDEPHHRRRSQPGCRVTTPPFPASGTELVQRHPFPVEVRITDAGAVRRWIERRRCRSQPHVREWSGRRPKLHPPAGRQGRVRLQPPARLGVEGHVAHRGELVSCRVVIGRVCLQQTSPHTMARRVRWAPSSLCHCAVNATFQLQESTATRTDLQKLKQPSALTSQVTNLPTVSVSPEVPPTGLEPVTCSLGNREDPRQASVGTVSVQPDTLPDTLVCVSSRLVVPFSWSKFANIFAA